MSGYVENKRLSLVERKKQQWAKEREELDGLCAPWGVNDGKYFDRHYGRNRYSTPPSKNDQQRKGQSGSSRRSSLPPLYKNQYHSNDRYEREMGGETSGYGSDNPNNTPEYPPPTHWHQSGYESSSSCRDDRAKWGDKRNSVGSYWENKENAEPPSWVKRGLQRDGEIVVSNTSPAESPQQDYTEQERPSTSSTSSFQRSYLRGQNVHMDSEEIAERERKRQIALAHQEAIRLQLEERERRRMEERQKRIKEEQEEDLRIEREQEIERQRREQEQRLIKEKQEREKKRNETIQEAIEIAEKEAKKEKMKLKMMKQNINVEKFKKEEKLVEDKENLNNLGDSNKNYINNDIKCDGRKSALDHQNNIIKISPRNNDNPTIEIQPKVLNTAADVRPKTPRVIDSSNRPVTPLIVGPKTENIALVLQPGLDALQSLQYALIVPSTSASIPVAIPMTVPNEAPSCTTRIENRLLTPTQYRLRNKKMCDSSTQTENGDFRVATADNPRESFTRDKYTNSGSNYGNKSSRRGRRSRSESVEDRPKWGVNRPPTRYVKQSEKDLLYQRKKMRQKNKYDDKVSSDESQGGSPRWRNHRYIEKRHTRALWKKDDQIFSRNMQLYQTEILPLETDKNLIFYEHKCCCRCNCSSRSKCPETTLKMDILKIEQTSPRDQYKSTELSGDFSFNTELTNQLNSSQSGDSIKNLERWNSATLSASGRKVKTI